MKIFHLNQGLTVSKLTGGYSLTSVTLTDKVMVEVKGLLGSRSLAISVRVYEVVVS